jgi:DNA-binding transcriptional LysR family regulator
MLDVHRLRLLRELSYRGTIAAVAQALSYTPSAVSQQLAVLERETGTALLERSGRSVRLTPTALMLVEHAEAVLDQLERADAALAAARTLLTARLRIGALPSVARAVLPRVLVALGNDHPGLELSVTELDPAVSADLVRAGDLDAALTHDYGPVPMPPAAGLESTAVLVEPLFLASTSPPADAHQLVASFRATAWVMGNEGTVCRRATDHICEAAGFTPRVRHQVDDFWTVLALVAAGQGPAIVPRMATVDAPAGIVLTELSFVRRIHLTYRRGAADHPAITALAEAIIKAVSTYLPTPLPADQTTPAGL